MFIVDIDQTISTGYAGNSLRESIEYYKQRGIVIPPDTTTYMQLFQLPEIMLIHEEIAGAREGVHYLLQSGEVKYFTVRKHQDQQTEKYIHNITKIWLLSKNFPNAENITFCRSTMHKLIQMHALGTQEEIIFIDDRWEKALEALNELDTRDEEARKIADFIRKQVTIVAFGAEQVPQREDIKLIALPSWLFVREAIKIGELHTWQ
jgi:hypothetical protein